MPLPPTPYTRHNQVFALGAPRVRSLVLPQNEQTWYPADPLAYTGLSRWDGNVIHGRDGKLWPSTGRRPAHWETKLLDSESVTVASPVALSSRNKSHRSRLRMPYGPALRRGASTGQECGSSNTVGG